MCTLTLAFQVFPDAPIVVAANRDELLERPSHPPAHRDWELPVVAPLDQTAGGTWIGYNSAGVLVAITNRWVDPELPAERSRGLLVRDALGYETAEAAVRAVEQELANHAYDGFNLTIVDPTAAIHLEWDGHLRVSTLTPGIHVIMNAGFDDHFSTSGTRPDETAIQQENARRIRETLQPEPSETAAEWRERAGHLLGNHDYGVCIHHNGYGTRSASLITIPANAPPSYQFADGPPCETEFHPVEATP